MLGELAAGLAHEIRNPLTSIKVLFGTMVKAKRIAADADGDSDMISKQIARLETIVEGFLKTSRAQVSPLQSKPLDFNATVDEAMLLLASSASEGTRLVVDLCAGDLQVNGDGTQLSQVVYNLALNAIQAVDKRGRISVITRRDVLPDGKSSEVVLE